MMIVKMMQRVNSSTIASGIFNQQSSAWETDNERENSLAQLFRPPYEIMAKCTLEEVCID
jgi:hypothetical protein